jgi:hypothetical protein
VAGSARRLRSLWVSLRGFLGISVSTYGDRRQGLNCPAYSIEMVNVVFPQLTHRSGRWISDVSA